MEFVALFLVELLALFFASQLLTRSLSRLFFRMTKSQTITIQLLSVLFLPGVVVHELAHMLMASILFVPVGDIEFLPKITDHGVKLGSVAIAKTDPIRRALIGFAPVFVGVFILFGVMFYLVTPLGFTTNGTLTLFIAAYVAFEIGNTMFSSRKDLEGTIELLVVFALFGLILYFLGVRIDTTGASQILSEEVIVFIKKAVFFLSLPIVIDLGVWGAIKIFTYNFQNPRY